MTYQQTATIGEPPGLAPKKSPVMDWPAFIASVTSRPSLYGYTAAQSRRIGEIANLTQDLRPPTVQTDDSGTLHVSFMRPAYTLMFEVWPDGSGSWFWRDVLGFVRKGEPSGGYGEDIPEGRDLDCGYLRLCIGLSAVLQDREAM